jgi:hypothetical protein
MYTARSNYQSTAGGDTEGCICAVVTVILCVCKPVAALKFFVGMICKCSVYPITDPDPISSH